MSVMVSQITSVLVVYFRLKKTSKFRSLTFVWRIHRWPVNSPLKGPVTRKVFIFDDVIMLDYILRMRRNSPILQIWINLGDIVHICPGHWLRRNYFCPANTMCIFLLSGFLRWCRIYLIFTQNIGFVVIIPCAVSLWHLWGNEEHTFLDFRLQDLSFIDSLFSGSTFGTVPTGMLVLHIETCHISYFS